MIDLYLIIRIYTKIFIITYKYEIFFFFMFSSSSLYGMV